MAKNKSCYNCLHCMYILEGDYICELEMDNQTDLQPVMEQHSPTGHYFWCSGKHWKEN